MLLYRHRGTLARSFWRCEMPPAAAVTRCLASLIAFFGVFWLRGMLQHALLLAVHGTGTDSYSDSLLFARLINLHLYYITLSDGVSTSRLS